MPGCNKKFVQKSGMQTHLLINCIQPDFLFCKECKYRFHDVSCFESHWTSEYHQQSCSILERRGIEASPPPVVNFFDEARKAEKNPVAYKASHCSTGILGSVQVPIYDIRGNTEKIDAFPGFTPYSGDLPFGTIWCAESGVPPRNQCASTCLHNLLWGPQTELQIPVTFKYPILTKDVTYSLPITGSFDCQTKIYNYAITCREHTNTRGIRGIGLSVDQAAVQRFTAYRYTIKDLKFAREEWEETHQRQITDDEFKTLLYPTHNSRKYRHFASADCSPDNIVFSILSCYDDRYRCMQGEAYYQYAIQSCDEKSGGLDEKPEYEGYRNKSDELSKLKVKKGQGTKEEKKKFLQFVTKN